MEELEFSQRIVKILTGKALQDTLRKAGMQGFTVPGFAKNVSQAPPSILAAAMTKRKRGKGFQSGIFLKCLSELDEDILESKLTQKWLEGGVSKEEAERELKDIEISILEKQKQNENVQDGIEIEDSIKTDDKDDTQVIKKQQERIKKLQATIQSYKIANDNYKKEIEQLKRENIKLEAKNAEELRNKTLMEDTIEELNNEIHEQKQKLAKMGTEIEKYKNTVNYKPKYAYEFFRRLVDIIFSLVALIPAVILILIFSIIIRIDSKGYPIFSQVRVGKNGKLMKIHKLRSMRIDAEANGQKWAEDDDPRITKVGKFIRKHRIDELPQLIDVLFGRMSLIGPRPEVPKLTVEFNAESPGFVTRLMVAPGLSGWAQINGGYNVTPKEKWILDNEYIEQRGFKMYFKIFYLTIKTVLTGEGAK